ncbi:MAG: iron-containing alcohol dehydrogenase, partial [Desulfobacteraceae bacterium]|nr:iron-containing alcohol dehydrogenase [Desulfobacteraceae bacterium]
MRQEEYIGFDTISQLRDILGRFGSQRIFLVTGKESYSSCGAKAYLDKILGDYEVSRFYEFEANPKIEDIQKGIKIFTHNSYDTVIAVGGGSVIDMAKAITFLAANPSAAAEYSIKGPPQATIAKPIVAIPTTSGSGSESTCFSVIYVGCKKYSISDENMLPKAAIVDAKLTMSLPVYTTAVSGLDAFSQAVESYWSIHSTYQSKQFASDAIKLTM